MPEINANPPATVPAQREAVGPVKKSTPVVIALVADRRPDWYREHVQPRQRQEEIRSAEHPTDAAFDCESAASSEL